MTIDLRFLPPIPDDMQLYYTPEEVAGVDFRIQNAVLFATGTEQDLELIREPNNPFDSNAIMILGSYVTGPFRFKVHIGYVAADTAREIAQKGLFAWLKPRLRNIWCGGYYKPAVTVRYDIMGPRIPKSKRRQPSGSQSN